MRQRLLKSYRKVTEKLLALHIQHFQKAVGSPFTLSEHTCFLRVFRLVTIPFLIVNAGKSHQLSALDGVTVTIYREILMSRQTIDSRTARSKLPRPSHTLQDTDNAHKMTLQRKRLPFPAHGSDSPCYLCIRIAGFLSGVVIILVAALRQVSVNH